MLHTRLPRGHNKIAANSLRGSLKQLDLRDNPGKKEAAEPGMSNNSPRPVFNGKRSNGNRPIPPCLPSPQEINDQHEELVSFLEENWRKIYNSNQGDPFYYREKSPNPKLQDFKGIDLTTVMSESQYENVMRSSDTSPSKADS